MSRRRVRSSQAGHDRDERIGLRDIEPDYDQVSETVEIRIEHERVKRAMEKLTELQHQLGEQVRAALHVHITHDLCLEVIVVRGRSDHLQAIADRMLALRGVKQGGIEIVTGIGQASHTHDPRSLSR